ncbi:GNAT family N-acetyltransferase [Pseudomonas fluorescens group sp.]|uniref:Acetyltransferase n=2 Tax=Pseudomonas fluorescens TaxID=294 RepID=C3K4F4_PSEFS|nr:MULTISPECIES: GNAT family protein [Pseudomonas fluorescens group]MBZ6454616.1 GNAT family N-acetyltransferase [Pseudomonas fluorescens group sp.]MBZ6461412.1 GNAT family N-acetyltransferase [Pseudomonas fluorescens group sp.]MBZ6466600.1 GNAT family N-acetyltransferase [Pseudomonas fluorescens group sp.]WQD72307.1 GNAT family protein [Pseudomonas marginalis]CAI2800194.1 Putative acetyltransferase [Pseudomonas fluorescens SBW25]
MTTSLADWKGVPAPTIQRLEGRFIRLEKLDPARHGDELFNALQGPGADPKLWDYLPYGPFPERSVFNDWLNNHAAHSDPYLFSVIDRATGQVQGILSLMSIVPDHGRIEIGHVTFGAAMQRSPKSTEAVYLLAKHAFDQGYRRLEWKCNNANGRSKYAAERLGFSLEGVFRQHTVVKGKNRDTAWYSIIDAEWPQVAAGFEAWLSEANQQGDGQVKSLAQCRSQHL